jgi:hypothetical protein
LEDFETDEQVWDQFISDCTANDIENLLNEFNEFINEDSLGVMKLLEKMTAFGGIGFDDKNELVVFVSEFRAHVLKKN